MRTRATLAVLLALVAGCGDPAAPKRSGIERAIDDALGARFGVAVHTHCFAFAPACQVRLADGSSLPILVTRHSATWEWHTVGLVFTTDEVEAYLGAEVADLGAPQEVRCAPRIRWIAAGDRIECALGGGGAGFVTVRVDGSLSIEVVLDASAAAARSEPLTPARELELVKASRALDRSEETGEEAESLPDAGELRGSPAPR